MDQNFSMSGLRSASCKAIIASLFIMFSFSSYAGNVFTGGYNEPGVNVTSSGVVNGEMTFRLNYENETADVLEIIITDNQGNRLYRKLSTDKKLNTTFRIPAEVGTVYLTVTNTKDRTQKRFQISSQERIVEKVVIGSVR